MKLIKVALEDLNALKQICISAYSLNFHNHWLDGGLEWYLDNEFSDKRLQFDLLDINTSYYFIQNDHKPIGFIKLKNSLSVDFEIENSSELEKIYILPKYKGLGIGKLAIESIIALLQQDSKKSLMLCVIDTNESAIAFYKKLGFTFHSKTTLDLPLFKEALKGMHRMIKIL